MYLRFQYDFKEAFDLVWSCTHSLDIVYVMEESFVVCSTSQPEWYFVVCNIFWRQRLGCWDHSFRAYFLGATAWGAALLFVFVFVAHLKGNYEAAIFWAVSNAAIFVIMSWNEKSFNFSKLLLIEMLRSYEISSNK